MSPLKWNNSLGFKAMDLEVAYSNSARNFALESPHLKVCMGIACLLCSLERFLIALYKGQQKVWDVLCNRYISRVILAENSEYEHRLLICLKLDGLEHIQIEVRVRMLKFGRAESVGCAM